MKKVLLTLAAATLMAAPVMAAPTGSPTVLDAGFGPNTRQYHSYDGLICTDCHSLHASDLNSGLQSAPAGDGKAAADGSTSDSTNYTFNGVTGPSKGYRELLKKGDWTDMCLSCHKEGNNTAATADLPGVVVDGATGWQAPIVMSLNGTPGVGANPNLPAGDFFYSNANAKMGHNPAYSKGATDAAPTSLLMTVDPILGATPPGNGGVSILTTDKEWSCHSCHGMHARFSDSYSAWRQVKRKVNGKVVTGNVTSYGVETIAGNETQNTNYEPIKSNSRGDIKNGSYLNKRGDDSALDGANLWVAAGDENKNIYRGGFSSFCAACHGDFHGGLNAGVAVTESEVGTAQTNTRTSGSAVWLRHPTNIKMGDAKIDTALYGANRKYGISTYRTKIKTQANLAGDNTINPAGYDWKYPLVKPDTDYTISSTVASATVAATLSPEDRIMCLTCHKAHASEYENMTRWDTNAHAFLPNGATDHERQTQVGDNLAYGCGKCHQKGGTLNFIKSF